MTRDQAIDKMISVRGHAFRRGVLAGEGDYTAAFRDLNRLYVELRSKRSAPERADVAHCLECDRELVGRRAGAEFCDDVCRKRHTRKPPAGQLTLGMS
jgi:hypothetical protein